MDVLSLLRGRTASILSRLSLLTKPHISARIRRLSLLSEWIPGGIFSPLSISSKSFANESDTELPGSTVLTWPYDWRPEGFGLGDIYNKRSLPRMWGERRKLFFFRIPAAGSTKFLAKEVHKASSKLKGESFLLCSGNPFYGRSVLIDLPDNLTEGLLIEQ
jgi:hypothetical protein